MLLISRKSSLDWNSQYFIVLPAVMLAGMLNRKYIKENVKKLYYTGVAISVCTVTAVIFLTNLEFLSVWGYLILGAMVSIIPLYETFVGCGEVSAKKAGRLITYILCLLLFHRGVAVCGYANEDGIKLVTDVENIIRVGPTKGIVASLQKCNEVRYTMEDWKLNVNDDTVLVVVPWMLDSIVYAFPKTDVSTFSTIDTPTYDENLLKYWEMYPEKVPTVIAVEGWNGNVSVDENTWIMKWIEENYTSYVEGHFWRFYKKE